MKINLHFDNATLPRFFVLKLMACGLMILDLQCNTLISRRTIEKKPFIEVLKIFSGTARYLTLLFSAFLSSFEIIENSVRFLPHYINLPSNLISNAFFPLPKNPPKISLPVNILLKKASKWICLRTNFSFKTDWLQR